MDLLLYKYSTACDITCMKTTNNNNEVTVSEVRCGVVSETSTGVERGVDVDLTVVLSDGTEIDGEVTLVPHHDGRSYVAYGPGADYWVGSNLLAALGACADLSEALAMIEREASAEVGEVR